ncbi:type IV secretion system protein VirD4 [Methylorubrum salsuginis]|uniref:Type IV secretion system protein VirD4 n=2 Tax=Methylorubrum salsuginis TaxID=414703 RepID=A0A1I4IRU8_9HYPH|nr:type IV secretion system protein VirD4 [Methylorubrum salsuginis]
MTRSPSVGLPLSPSLGWPARIGLSMVALGLLAAVYLFVASNVLLLGLRVHDGGLHWMSVIEYGTLYGHDPRVARWMRLSLLGTGLVFLFGLGAAVRVRPPPLHGRARFATEREIRADGLRAGSGLLLGAKDGRYLCFGGTEHVIGYAPTRSGKGVGLVIPNLLNWPDSVVCLDVKRENWERTAGFRAAHGQEVYLFDPFDEEGRTARYNPLSVVRRDSGDRYDDLQRIATMLFPAETGTDPFWHQSARAAFIAIGGYVAETPGLPLTIGEVLRQLSAAADLKAHFAKAIAERRAGPDRLSPRCVQALNDFLAASDNTFQSVRKTVTARLELWFNPRVDRATAASSFDLQALRTRPISIYLAVSPDNLERLSPLLNLFFQQVVDLNTRELPEQNPTLRRQVLLLLDEFPTLGNVAVLARGVAFLAGYGLRLLTILQSPSQLRAIYGPDVARNIMTNHAVEVVFTPKDQEVANELSERFGYDTVEGRSRSRPSGLLGSGSRGYSETLSEQKRALLLPQELKLVSQDKCFILKAGLRPILADKIRYFTDRRFQARLHPPPRIRIHPSPGDSDARWQALSDEVDSLRTELGAITRTLSAPQPVSDDEIHDPSRIPEDAVFNFGDVEVDLAGLSEDEIRNWTIAHIDRQVAASPRTAALPG